MVAWANGVVARLASRTESKQTAAGGRTSQANTSGVSRTLDATLAVADAPPRREAAARARTACFHCGEPCPDDSIASGPKRFCCNGCLTVHDILTRSGLGQFYELNERPGIRVRPAEPRERWTFLDEPEVQQRLLDFTDGRQSRITLHLPAIHCVACVWLLENLFRLHPGIGGSQVNFGRREVAITFTPEKIKLSDLVALLASIGYEPTLTLNELEKRALNPMRKRQWLQVGVAGFAFGNIMLFSLPQYFGLDGFSGPAFKTLFGWLSLALALPVVVFSASDYWKSALLSLRQRMLTLEVPIALGLAAIYGQSLYEILSGVGEGYCDSLTGLIFFLLCGRAFQQKTQERLAFDRDYKSFFPLSVTRIRPDTARIQDASRADEAEREKWRKGERELLERAEPLPSSPFPLFPSAESQLWAAGSPASSETERVSLSQLRVGDRILIRNRELIPADGKLLNGPAFIDYSFVTGESEPVAKQAGDYLYAGGQQIGAAIEVEVVKAVSQSYLTSLWNHEAFRKRRHHSLDTLTNRYSRRFTLIVVAVALLAGLFWTTSGDLPRGIKAFVSVLIVACPCALALAAPFTLGTAQRWLARWSIFLKNAFVIERMARVDTIVFDKTGTLTSAGVNAVKFVRAPECDAPSLTPARSCWESENRSQSSGKTDTGDIRTIVKKNQNGRLPSPLPAGEGEGEGELTEDEARWIFSLTRHSTHPHSVRISESFGGKLIPEPVCSFLETPGCGIAGQVDGREIRLGSRAWLESCGITAGQAARLSPSASRVDGERQEACSIECGSTVHVAIGGRYRGAFVLTSRLRPEADRLVQKLAGHYELALLSGDNERERERFRTLFGDKAELNFNQSPLDKLGFIRRLQESGKTVMMVGDGLNDAGALQQSDIGVAVVEEVGAFSPASDVILDAARVPQLLEILKLARRAARIVRAGFAISAAYNVGGVGIAAAGLLSPVVCAVLMPVSSVTVVLFACGVTTWAARGIKVKTQIRNPKSETGGERSAPRDADPEFRTSGLQRA